MAVAEQSIQGGINAINSGQKFDNYIEECAGPEDKAELSLALRCRIIESYSDSDISDYVASVESHIAGLEEGPGKQRYQTILDSLNAEKTFRGI